MQISTISVRELRPRLPKVMADISNNLTRYLITRRGKPEVMMLSVEDYESLIETLGIEREESLSDRRKVPPRHLKPKEGRILEEIRKELEIE